MKKKIARKYKLRKFPRSLKFIKPKIGGTTRTIVKFMNIFAKEYVWLKVNRAVVVVFSNIDGVACVFTFIIVLLINSANALFHDCSNKIFQRKNGKSCRAQPNSTR